MLSGPLHDVRAAGVPLSRASHKRAQRANALISLASRCLIRSQFTYSLIRKINPRIRKMTDCQAVDISLNTELIRPKPFLKKCSSEWERK